VPFAKFKGIALRYSSLVPSSLQLPEREPCPVREGVEEIKKNYLEPFFVGLLEGVGTITTNLMQSSYNSIRVSTRVVIALKNEKNNHYMLNKIQNIIGGRVVIERKEKYVTWIASSKSDINKVLLILARYPLLTVRKQCQLEFAKKCLLYKDVTDVENVDKYLLNRQNMYKNMIDLQAMPDNTIIMELPVYFYAWLSGFIEADGNFTLVFNENGKLRKSAFNIRQKDEFHVLKLILFYFKMEEKI
jgi:hypothetical protein